MMTEHTKPSPEQQTRAHVMLPVGGTYIGFAPGSEGADGDRKRWPLENYIRLAKAQEYRVPIFFLKPGEEEWKTVIRGQVPAAIFPLQQKNMAPEPLLIVALAERMSASVCNDSAMGHLLAQSGKPLIALFGPSDPAEILGVSSRVQVIKADDMAAISYDAVSTALEDALQAGSSRSPADLSGG